MLLTCKVDYHLSSEKLSSAQSKLLPWPQPQSPSGPACLMPSHPLPPALLTPRRPSQGTTITLNTAACTCFSSPWTHLPVWLDVSVLVRYSPTQLSWAGRDRLPCPLILDVSRDLLWNPEWNAWERDKYQFAMCLGGRACPLVPLSPTREKHAPPDLPTQEEWRSRDSGLGMTFNVVSSPVKLVLNRLPSRPGLEWGPAHCTCSINNWSEWVNIWITCFFKTYFFPCSPFPDL